MRILALRFSSLGDVILQTSVISWLKLELPESHIVFATSDEFTPLLADHPHIDKVVAVSRKDGAGSLIKSIKKIDKDGPFDLILDLHDTLRSKLIRYAFPFRRKIVVDKRRLYRDLLVKFKLNKLKETSSIHERNILDLQGVLGLNYDKEKLLSFIDTESPSHLTSSSYHFKNSSSKEKIIIVTPVASFAAKRWPMSSFINLTCDLLENPSLKEYKVIALAGPSDHYAQKFSELENKYPSERFENLCGKTSLSVTGQLIAKSSLCIGNDSGLNHIAESCAVPVITIFGPTHPDFGFKPHLEKSCYLYSKESCSPCSTTGKKKCSKSSHLCMENISVKTVLDQVQKILVGES